MLQLTGRPAFSAFRLEKLLSAIQTEVASVSAIRTEYRYFVDLNTKASTIHQAATESV